MAIILIAIAAIIRLASSSKRPDRAGEPEKELSVEDLKREKDRIQELINIAKRKYHRRQLDEESFREIVRDNQVKIIQLQQQINDLSGRVGDLEEK